MVTVAKRIIIVNQDKLLTIITAINNRLTDRSTLAFSCSCWDLVPPIKPSSVVVLHLIKVAFDKSVDLYNDDADSYEAGLYHLQRTLHS